MRQDWGAGWPNDICISLVCGRSEIESDHWFTGGSCDHVSSADITVNLNAPYDNLKIIMSKK